MKQKIKTKKRFILHHWAIFILVGFIFGLFFSSVKLPMNVDFTGFKEVDVKLAPNVVLLLDKDDGCTVLPIFVSPEQITLIAMGMRNETIGRPLTHDLITNTLAELQVEIVAVTVVNLNESTYYANLILRKGNEIFEIDSRPSDAVAIAVRTGSPVYVKRQLLEQYGESICRNEEVNDNWWEEVKEAF